MLSYSGEVAVAEQVRCPIEFGEGCEKKHSRILAIMTVAVAIKPKIGL